MINLIGKHYNSVTGGSTVWKYKDTKITLEDGSNSYQVLHFVTGMDGNTHGVFWNTKSLEEAIEYLERAN